MHICLILKIEKLKSSKKSFASKPGLAGLSGFHFYEAWEKVLSNYEKERFIEGYWGLALDQIVEDTLRNYLFKRYGVK